MGGAVHVGGNLCCGAQVGYDNSQEFNIWIDPAAAQTVFTSLPTMRVRLIPLDATNQVPVTPAFVARLQADHHTAEADLVAAIASDPTTTELITLGA
jgi:purine nucleosidase